MLFESSGVSSCSFTWAGSCQDSSLSKAGQSWDTNDKFTSSSLKKKKKFYFLNNVCWVCTLVQCPRRPKGGIASPGAGVTEDCQPPCLPSARAASALTAALSLFQPPCLTLLWSSSYCLQTKNLNLGPSSTMSCGQTQCGLLLDLRDSHVSCL